MNGLQLGYLCSHLVVLLTLLRGRRNRVVDGGAEGHITADDEEDELIANDDDRILGAIHSIRPRHQQTERHEHTLRGGRVRWRE